MKAIKLPRLPDWLTPIALFGVVILAYGIYIPWMGMYGDDWIFLLNQKVFGPLGFIPFFASDRPFSGWILVLTSFLARDNTWVYQVLGVLLRGLDVVALWWLLKVIWPRHSRQALWAALLFAVYPGFVQQFIPMEFSIHFFVLGAFLVSLGLMVQAVRSPQRALPRMTLAVLCAAGMFSIEYFVGLELLRPVILWLVLSGETPDLKKRFVRLLKYWLPFLAVLAAFFIWRVFIFKFHFYQPALLQNFIATPWETLLHLGARILADSYKTALLAWLQIFNMQMGLHTLLLFLPVVVAGLVVACFIILKLPEGKIAAEDAKFSARWKWIWPAGLVCLVSFFVAGIPIDIPGVPLEVYFPWDRAVLPFMLGACLFLVVLLEFIPPRIGRFALAVLLSLSLGYSMKNARSYINDVSLQRDLIWQMVWRAPQIKPGTLLLFENLNLDHLYDNDFSPIVNWTYAPGLAANPIPYRLFDLNKEQQSLDTFLDTFTTPDIPFTDTYDTFTFVGSSANMVLFSYDSPGCLLVLGPQNDYLPHDIPREAAIQRLTNPDLLLPNASPAVHPPLYLAKEPAHTWCYYYEKADLARQQKDWAQVVTLWKEAAGKSYLPETSYEFAPFIEAFVQLNNWDMARQLSLQAKDITQNFTRKGTVDQFCLMWDELAQRLPVNVQNPQALGKIKQELGCQIQ